MICRTIPALLAALALAAAARAETVYFVSKTNGALYTFDTTAGGIAPLTGTNTFPNATALAMGPDGNLYVGDATDGGSIRRYVLSSGSVATVASLTGAGPAVPGGPVNPGAIAFTPGGDMLVGRNPEVAFFTGGTAAWPRGPVLSMTGWRAGESPSISAFTTGTAQDYSPGLAVAADGRLFASNSVYSTETLQMTGDVFGFDASGTFQSAVATGNPPAGLFGPAGLALVGNSLFTASTMNGSIFKTDLLTGTTTFFTMTPVDPVTFYPDFIGPLAATTDGSLLAGSVDANQGLIYLFDGSGGIVTTFAGEEYGQIGGIVAVPEPSAAWLAIGGVASLGLWSLRRRRA